MLRRIFGTLGILLIVSIVVFIILAGMGPDTFVVPGRQLDQKYRQQLRSMGLIDQGEKIAYFYSDALRDIRDGLYFVSDKKVVAYSTDWNPPAIAIPLDSVVDLSFERDESFWEDSVIWIRAQDGTEIAVPVSSEQGGDKRFYEYLVRMCKNAEVVEQVAEEREENPTPTPLPGSS